MQPDYDHAGLHRSKDVGISGFTGYHNQKMFTTRFIPGENEDTFLYCILL